MPQITATHANGGWAVFLDVDGTLLEIAATPQDVYVPASLKQLLNTLRLRLDGALALVSGRTIADLDRLFAPLQLCTAGVHGFERREPDGRLVRPEVDAAALDYARAMLSKLVESFPELLFEDKRSALAMHFRRAPCLQALVHERVAATVAALGPGFTLLAGKCVYEIRPIAWTKATAVAGFMEQPPFRGRVPVFIGDDVTDEDAFALVNARSGVSIRVGAAAATLARYRLPNVHAVVDWLRGVALSDVPRLQEECEPENPGTSRSTADDCVDQRLFCLPQR